VIPLLGALAIGLVCGMLLERSCTAESEGSIEAAVRAAFPVSCDPSPKSRSLASEASARPATLTTMFPRRSVRDIFTQS